MMHETLDVAALQDLERGKPLELDAILKALATLLNETTTPHRSRR